ncbi:MAG: hypothetical protein M3548_18750 [Actinomycetota bacterium]|nr:hypothetical protein [Actinomycetota bacterium]
MSGLPPIASLTIKRASLVNLGARIGKGGQASVHDLPGPGCRMLSGWSSVTPVRDRASFARESFDDDRTAGVLWPALTD